MEPICHKYAASIASTDEQQSRLPAKRANQSITPLATVYKRQTFAALFGNRLRRPLRPPIGQFAAYGLHLARPAAGQSASPKLRIALPVAASNSGNYSGNNNNNKRARGISFCDCRNFQTLAEPIDLRGRPIARFGQQDLLARSSAASKIKPIQLAD